MHATVIIRQKVWTNSKVVSPYVNEEATRLVEDIGVRNSGRPYKFGIIWDSCSTTIQSNPAESVSSRLRIVLATEKKLNQEPNIAAKATVTAAFKAKTTAYSITLVVKRDKHTWTLQHSPWQM